MALEWAQLQQLSFKVELLTFNLRQFLLLLSKLLRKQLLLIVHDLEIFARAKQLIIIIGGLAFGLQHLVAGVFDQFLELVLLRKN